jgi:hypothetical protein
VVTLNERPGCYYIYGSAPVTPTYTIDQLYIDCPECQATQNPQQSWKVVNCSDPNDIRYVNDDFALQPGLVVQIDDQSCAECCFEVTEGSTIDYDWDVNAIFDNCEECEGQTYPYNYLIQECDGATVFGMKSTTPVQVGTVVKVSNWAGVGDPCFVVIGTTPNPQFLILSQIFENCETCEGVQILPTCHDLTAGPSGAQGSYERSGATFFYFLGPNQVGNFCGINGSFTVTSGSLTSITNVGPQCTTDGDCQTLPANSTCHELCSQGPNPEGFTTFEFVNADGNPERVKVPDNTCLIVCAFAGTIQVIAGNGFYIDIQTQCDSTATCN